MATPCCSSIAASAASSRSRAPTARAALNGLVTNDIERARRPAAGSTQRVLTPKGKMLGDLRVLADR